MTCSANTIDISFKQSELTNSNPLESITATELNIFNGCKYGSITNSIDSINLYCSDAYLQLLATNLNSISGIEKNYVGFRHSDTNSIVLPSFITSQYISNGIQQNIQGSIESYLIEGSVMLSQVSDSPSITMNNQAIHLILNSYTASSLNIINPTIYNQASMIQINSCTIDRASIYNSPICIMTENSINQLTMTNNEFVQFENNSITSLSVDGNQIYYPNPITLELNSRGTVLMPVAEVAIGQSPVMFMPNIQTISFTANTSPTVGIYHGQVTEMNLDHMIALYGIDIQTLNVTAYPEDTVILDHVSYDSFSCNSDFFKCFNRGQSSDLDYTSSKLTETYIGYINGFDLDLSDPLFSLVYESDGYRFGRVFQNNAITTSLYVPKTNSNCIVHPNFICNQPSILKYVISDWNSYPTNSTNFIQPFDYFFEGICSEAVGNQFTLVVSDVNYWEQFRNRMRPFGTQYDYTDMNHIIITDSV
jgi:hypothetical protein